LPFDSILTRHILPGGERTQVYHKHRKKICFLRARLYWALRG
jgi:hypothetical protein